MDRDKMPKYVSHIVIVHGGSYTNFCTQLTSRFPHLQMKFIKTVQVHYYIIQLEDHSDKIISKEDIYSLPILAMREEFSNFIFFKNMKAYTNVLRRMCDSSINPGANYTLAESMMTPYEKGELIDIENAEYISIPLMMGKDKVTHHYSKAYIKPSQMEIYNQLFKSKSAIRDNEEISFAQKISGYRWTVGIH